MVVCGGSAIPAAREILMYRPLPVTAVLLLGIAPFVGCDSAGLQGVIGKSWGELGEETSAGPYRLRPPEKFELDSKSTSTPSETKIMFRGPRFGKSEPGIILSFGPHHQDISQREPDWSSAVQAGFMALRSKCSGFQHQVGPPTTVNGIPAVRVEFSGDFTHAGQTRPMQGLGYLMIDDSYLLFALGMDFGPSAQANVGKMEKSLQTISRPGFTMPAYSWNGGGPSSAPGGLGSGAPGSMGNPPAYPGSIAGLGSGGPSSGMGPGSGYPGSPPGSGMSGYPSGMGSGGMGPGSGYPGSPPGSGMSGYPGSMGSGGMGPGSGYPGSPPGSGMSGYPGVPGSMGPGSMGPGRMGPGSMVPGRSGIAGSGPYGSGYPGAGPMGGRPLGSGYPGSMGPGSMGPGGLGSGSMGSGMSGYPGAGGPGFPGASPPGGQPQTVKPEDHEKALRRAELAKRKPEILAAASDPGQAEYYQANVDLLRLGESADMRQAIKRLAEIQVSDIGDADLRKEIARTIRDVVEDADVETDVRRAAIPLLIIWGSTYSAPIFTGLLQDENRLIQVDALQALTKLHDEQTIEPVTQLFISNPVLRKDAADCLRSFGSSAEDVVLELVRPSDFLITQATVQLLGDIGTRKSVDRMRLLRKLDFYKLVQQDVTEAIAKIRGREATEEKS